LILKHWTDTLPQGEGHIPFPFHVENFCHENDELLKKPTASEILEMINRELLVEYKTEFGRGFQAALLQIKHEITGEWGR
jgi:hypothetical protein